MSESSIFVGMDVHQDSVTLAVFEGASKKPAIVQRLPNDLRTLRRSTPSWPGSLSVCSSSGQKYSVWSGGSTYGGCPNPYQP